MSEKIDLMNQSLRGLHLLLDYCRSKDLTPTRYIETSKMDKDWFKCNKQYINLEILSEDQQKSRDEIIKNLQKT